VGTVAAAQMGSEGSMALTQRLASWGTILSEVRAVRSEVGAFENEQHGGAVVANPSGEMQGCALLVTPCIDRCFCFHQYATDLDMALCCSAMEGCVLLGILCPGGRCS
jgi:hypothetical protein